MKRIGLFLLLAVVTGSLALPPAAAQDVVYYGGNHWLGVALADPAAAGVAHSAGAVVRDVFPDGPAARAGLQKGDVITALNDRAVSNVANLQAALRSAHPQQQVALHILRNGQPQTVQVQLAPPPPPLTAMPPIPPMPPVHIPEIHIAPIHIPPIPPMSLNMEKLMSMPEMSSMSMGMSVETMPEQLAGYFGVKQGQRAVLVRSVAADSPARKAGFRAGDVILRMNGHAVHSVADFWKSLSAARGKAASAGVLRHGRPVTIKIAAVPSDAGFRMPDRQELQRQIAEAQREAEKAQREFNSPQFRKQMEEVKRQAAASAEQWRKQAEQLRQQSQQWQ